MADVDEHPAPRRRPRPELLRSTVSLKHVKLGYHYLIQNGLYLLLGPLLLLLVSQLWQTGLGPVWATLQGNLAATLGWTMALAMAATVYAMSRPAGVYMVDFSCYSPLKQDMCSNAEFLRYSAATGAFNERSLGLQRKICERSGLGDETYLPPAVISEPPNPCMAEARLEAERVMFGALDRLFYGGSGGGDAGIIPPSAVDILIVNCSLFVPTPSLTSIIVRHYNLRPNIKSFNLGGMGCSAGIVSIDLAKHLLRSSGRWRRRSAASVALVVSMENITLNWYWGNDTSKLVSNCIFRMGGAAILLTNKPSLRRRSKYELVHTVRTHKGADDVAFRCVYQEEDEARNVGVSLSKELMAIAGEALKTNITTLGPMVLPMSEQILFFATLLLRRFGGKRGLRKLKPYIPDFKLAFEHFCIHAGGRAVLDELEKNLELSEWHMEPSRMTLFRFGNTSSSSLWYELAYTEAKGRVRKGDRLWQIAFGSGFKCNSAVWRSLRHIPPIHHSNPWTPFIHTFPVPVPTIRNLTTHPPSSAAT